MVFALGGKRIGSMYGNTTCMSTRKRIIATNNDTIAFVVAFPGTTFQISVNMYAL